MLFIWTKQDKMCKFLRISSYALFLVLASKHSTGKSNFTVYLCVVRSLEKEDFLENLCILSCFVQLKSVLFNLFCVFDLRCLTVLTSYCLLGPMHEYNDRHASKKTVSIARTVLLRTRSQTVKQRRGQTQTESERGTERT